VIPEQFDLEAVIANQATKNVQTHTPLRIVVSPLGRQHRDRVIVRRKFHAQIVGIADVQEPAVSVPDGNPAVPQRVTEQRDQKNLSSGKPRQRAGFDPEPPHRRSRVRHPPRSVSKLGGGIPPVPRSQPREFFFRHVHRRSREVSQSADMVRVAVCEDNVSHVRSLEPERLNLPDGSQRLVKLKPGSLDGGLTDPLDWVSDVLQTDAGVDEG
jgi:hypothetical protein